jgi:hypothetical protein
VIELMKESILDVSEDPRGFIDFRRPGGMSRPKQVQAFVAALKRVADREDCNTFTLVVRTRSSRYSCHARRLTAAFQQLQKIASDMKLPIDNFDDFLDVLNNQGYLLKKAPRYAVQQSTCARCS